MTVCTGSTNLLGPPATGETMEALVPLSPFAGEKGVAMSKRSVSGVVAGDGGAATAEYAITIMAAVGFAGLLVVILKSGEVQAILSGLVRSALSVGG